MGDLLHWCGLLSDYWSLDGLSDCFAKSEIMDILPDLPDYLICYRELIAWRDSNSR